MKIAIGDSFTYGEELQDRHTQAWPALIGYENYGLRGASNEYIFRKSVELASTSSHMIIAWSECTRYDFYTNIPVSVANRYKNYTGPVQVNPGWATVKNPWNEHAMPFFRDLYVKFTDEKYHFIKTLSYMTALQDVLYANQVEYYYCSSFSNNEMFEKYANDDEVKLWIDRLNTKMFIGYPKQGFVEWAYGTPHGPDGHPLEQGHKRIAEEILNHALHSGR